MKKILILFSLLLFIGSLYSQANLPFEEDFESGVFNANTVPFPNMVGVDGVVEIDDGVGRNGTKGLKMGKLLDNTGFTTNSFDIYLDLSGHSNVEMTFWISDNRDETDDMDGLYFSDDGGDFFTKAVDFHPSEWCDDEYGQYPPIDVDKVAMDLGLNLTNQFIIRFQQKGEDDFLGSPPNSADGFYLDDIKICNPNIIYSNLPLTDDFESGVLSNSWSWTRADQTSVEPTSFAITSPMSIVEIQNNIGRGGSKGIAMGRRCDAAFTVNALDLHLDLENEDNVELTFWISDDRDETDNDDGLYFSDDGGQSFVKAFDFYPSEWCDDEYGQHPPIDVDEIARNNGLNLTSQFVIRFQQRGEDDFLGSPPNSADGFYLDDIEIYNPNIIYSSVPFTDDFENGVLNNSWSWTIADQTSAEPTSFAITSPMSIVEIQDNIGRGSSKGIAMGRRCDAAFTVNALDLHLDLENRDNVEMTFWISDNRDETDNDDGLYFSDDGGQSFTKVFNFDFSSSIDDVFEEYNINISQLLMDNDLESTDKFIIRFQQRGEDDFLGSPPNSADGIYIDDINISGISNIAEGFNLNETVILTPNPFTNAILIKTKNTNHQISKLEITNNLGQKIRALVIQPEQNTTHINLSSIPVGTYYVNIYFEDGKQITRRIIKF